MVRTTLTACRPVCITTGSLAASHGSGREIFDQRAGAGVVIIGLSLMGSFRQNACWVRLAKTPVGFVWPKCPLGSFGQNACWVRLAKTPAGASLDRQSRAVRGAESAESAERPIADAA